MRRLGSKGSKRRKSETSSDTDSGENDDNGGGSANDTANSNAGNDHENDNAVIKATPISKKRSRVRCRRDDHASSVSGKSESATVRNDVETNGEQQTSDDTKAPPDVEQNNSNRRKSSAKRRKKEKTKSTASTSQENDNEYEVEKIVAHRTIKGRRQFLVRWKGYGEDSDTWEQEKDLNCPNLIEDFMADEEVRNDEEKVIKEDKNEKAPKAVSKSKKAKKISTRKDKNKQNQSRRKEDSKDDEKDVKEFEVEKIIEVHFKKNKEREFLIRWKGFNANDDTWEPEENLNCPDLIAKFMDRVKKVKSTDARELRTNPAHTKRYTLSMHGTGRRWSRRNVDKQRTTYYQCDE